MKTPAKACSECGGERRVAQQSVTEKKNPKTGLKEKVLGEEEWFCKSCRAPWPMENDRGDKEKVTDELPKLLDGPPPHLK